ncbi:glycosyltransferase [Spongisporangium articulatum]|uniref:4,4'-diaponeurosporenoate glycosyltransferase n=1 Tax=Spongisporangium articulatum TaxID=3362603 RepID=A0ABW8AT48_9ACTN
MTEAETDSRPPTLQVRPDVVQPDVAPTVTHTAAPSVLPDAPPAPRPGRGARPRASFSVVIPAHDEERTIGRCLDFAAELEPGEAEIVVVANGCTDETATVAASVPGVRVILLDAAGKTDALNAGDAVSAAYPRVYLDADIAVSADTLRRMRDALSAGTPRICAPTIRFATDGRPWSVRAFYRIYEQLPYVRCGLVGLGIYGISAEGRRRFDGFPRITADDLYVQRMFTADERTVLDDAEFVVQTPRTLRALLRVRTRTAVGNAELAGVPGASADFGRTGGGTTRALVGLVARHPGLLPAGLVYAGVTAVSRMRARLRRNHQWHRDTSTR